ncbi:MAG: methyltransferase domain-containing protein [Deltaproteobacteria bacterium]|nr:methyltransferase domain-containing protein [Deltaproteobacteria bacterium]
MQGFWNRLKAQWYRKGLDYSTLPKVALSFILPRTESAKTFLDVGSGCGTLSIPLAKAGKKVTALDPSKAMIEILEEDIRKQGLEKSIKPLLAGWGEAELKPHDVIICANVPALLKEPEPFIKEAQKLAKKTIFLIENADPNADKFYYRELYPLLFNKPFGERADFITTYNALHRMGIFANVEIIDYDFDQPFENMEEAVEFWKEYIGIVTEEFDKALEDFLSKKLVKKKGKLFAKFHKKSAITWWRVEKK